MRVKPLGKIVLFLLFLGGMYALWTRLPASYRQWDPVALKDRIPVPDLKPATAETDAPATVDHAGWAIGYAGTPPPALVDASQSNRPAPALAATLGEDTVLVREPDPDRLLEGLRGGALDAAVLDFPSVVYASTDEKTPFRVILLVGWRLGSDVLAVRGPGAWKPEMRTGYVAGSSGEYIVRRALRGGGLSPAERTKAESRLLPVASAKEITQDHEAAAGRLDLIGALPVGWMETWTTAEASREKRMPDVLVVREDLARTLPDRVEALVQGWLKAQSDTGPLTENWKKYVKTQVGATGMRALDIQTQMEPASLEDQQAFVGLHGGQPVYIDLVVEQTRATQSGGPVAPRPPSVRVDRQPLERVLAKTRVE